MALLLLSGLVGGTLAAAPAAQAGTGCAGFLDPYKAWVESGDTYHPHYVVATLTTLGKQTGDLPALASYASGRLTLDEHGLRGASGGAFVGTFDQYFNDRTRIWPGEPGLPLLPQPFDAHQPDTLGITFWLDRVWLTVGNSTVNLVQLQCDHDIMYSFTAPSPTASMVVIALDRLTDNPPR